MVQFASIIDAQEMPIVVECNVSDNTTSSTDQILEFNKFVNLSLDYFQSAFFQQPDSIGYVKFFQLNRVVVYGSVCAETGVKYVIGLREGDKADKLKVGEIFTTLADTYLRYTCNPRLNTVKKSGETERIQMLSRDIAKRVFPL